MTVRLPVPLRLYVPLLVGLKPTYSGRLTAPVPTVTDPAVWLKTPTLSWPTDISAVAPETFTFPVPLRL